MSRALLIGLRLIGWGLFIVSFVTPLGGSGPEAKQRGIELFQQSLYGGLLYTAIGTLGILLGGSAAGFALIGMLFLICGLLPNLSVFIWRLPPVLCLMAIIMVWSWLLATPMGLADPGIRMNMGIPRRASECLCYYPWAFGITIIHVSAMLARLQKNFQSESQDSLSQNSAAAPSSQAGTPPDSKAQ